MVLVEPVHAVACFARSAQHRKLHVDRLAAHPGDAAGSAHAVTTHALRRRQHLWIPATRKQRKRQQGPITKQRRDDPSRYVRHVAHARKITDENLAIW